MKKLVRLAFISNFLTHHIKPLCDEFNKILGEEFVYIACESTPETRMSLGYSNLNDTCEYVIKAYESQRNKNEALEIARTCDAVIIGSASIEFLGCRNDNNLPTFHFSERIFKKTLSFLLRHPRTVLAYALRGKPFKKDSLVYLLCCSAFAPFDYKRLLWRKNRMYRWAYFTEAVQYNVSELMNYKETETITIMWAGRFIDWKHPEKVISVAEYLNKNGLDFDLIMVGEGPMLEQMRCLCSEKNITNKVHIIGSRPYSEVRKLMEKSNIFLFTSDRNEGWGAVLNEAMNSGCAIVASHLIGAVPYLLVNGVNGYVYRNDEIEDLCKKVFKLVTDKSLCRKFGEAAYQTIINEWSPAVGAQRFLTLAKALGKNEDCELFKDGPCSKAPIIKNNWM